MGKNVLIKTGGVLGIVAVTVALAIFLQPKKVEAPAVIEVVPTATPSAAATPTPTPTKKTFSFTELNDKYGPCTNLPVLMYHHVEDEEIATKNKRTGLNVPPEMFKKQMEYLVEKGYHSITPQALSDFFDNGTALPNKPVLITFDDGYTDIGEEAFPIMKETGIQGTLYLPTGLMENFDYLTWAKIDEMKSSGVFNFGNHTWSHKNVGAAAEEVKKEIGTADSQLEDRGINNFKTFAYPYGLETPTSVKILSDMGYKLAFTTQPGRIMCKGKRLDLPRVRIGNAPLSVFGL